MKEELVHEVPAATDDPPPPSYHHIEASSSSSIRSQRRPPPPVHPNRSRPSSTPSPSPPISIASSPTFTSLINSGLETGKSRLKSGLIELLSGGTAQNVKDARNMAYKSLRDVVKTPEAQQSVALIETCAEVCRNKGINFAEILQDPVFEGHRALYWVIISRPPPQHYGLLSTILKYTGPLSSEAVDEVRLACVQVGDQELFSHLWRHPAYGALSGADELLLGGAAPTDCVEVQEATALEVGTFLVRFQITQFHKRMTISGKIMFEFIARGPFLCAARFRVANLTISF